MKYHFKIHKEKNGGYWAESMEPNLNANTQADTMEELMKNMKEVLELCLEEPNESNYIPPMPDPTIKGRNIVEISPDPKIALAALIRKERLEAKWTQRETATRLGIKHVSQYQRLESGKTVNAEFGTLVKLKKAFPDFSVDEALS
ncbi:MAG: type II toxin-antitoxin system HicB family antitoxin [Fibrobacterota bacterium]|nr:type II toxin-antitoxin system HicB family antitoxin [Fibrobacterota bacterium]